MHRLLIIDPAENTRVPYLRGILTRSLQESGLSFEDSYEVATSIRQELAESREITTAELREKVAARLESFGEEAVQRYQNPQTPTILVRYEDDETFPYSRGRNRANLESCGFSSEDSLTIATNLHEQLALRQISEIGITELRRLNYEHVGNTLGKKGGHSYLVWQEFRMSERPLILLLGGTPGVGKSTLATQVANLLDIVRIQSTDMLREVMRMMMPERLLPVLHTSSFKAWERLPEIERTTDGSKTLLENGYLHQAELLSVACEAVIQRALKERVALILEGVHVHPRLLEYVPKENETIVVPMMLAVLKRRDLRTRIRGRSKEATDRRAKRYLEHIDSIWQLQSFLLSEADRYGVPIVANEDKERTRLEVLSIVHAELERQFSGDPAKVLG